MRAGDQKQKYDLEGPYFPIPGVMRIVNFWQVQLRNIFSPSERYLKPTLLNLAKLANYKLFAKNSTH